VCEYERGEARKFAQSVALTFSRCFAVAVLLSAVATLPAEAKKNYELDAKPSEETIPDPKDGQPMTFIISLRDQKIDIYRGTLLIASSKVSSGMRGYATKPGVWAIKAFQKAEGLPEPPKKVTKTAVVKPVPKPKGKSAANHEASRKALKPASSKPTLSHVARNASKVKKNPALKRMAAEQGRGRSRRRRTRLVEWRSK
jgi:hypothetical protein